MKTYLEFVSESRLSDEHFEKWVRDHQGEFDKKNIRTKRLFKSAKDLGHEEHRKLVSDLANGKYGRPRDHEANLRSVHATQSEVYKHVVKDISMNHDDKKFNEHSSHDHKTGSDKLSGRPVYVKTPKGEVHLINGHHRAVSLLSRNQHKMKGDLYHIDHEL